jgi:hypothetical protein
MLLVLFMRNQHGEGSVVVVVSFGGGCEKEVVGGGGGGIWFILQNKPKNLG